MTTTSEPCPVAPCDGTMTVTADDRGTSATCNTCAFRMVTANRGQLDLGITGLARPIVPTIQEWVHGAARAEMRRLAILQEIYAIEQWAAADDVGMQALHIVATHAEDGYGLASSTRREQPGG